LHESYDGSIPLLLAVINFYSVLIPDALGMDVRQWIQRSTVLSNLLLPTTDLT